MTWLLLSTAALAVDPCTEPAEVLAERSAAIRQTYDDGEAERADRSLEAESVLKRDEARVKEVLKYDKKGQLCTADDQWYAAWVMGQADNLPTLERAYALAKQTMDARHKNGPWLVAFTFDRKRIAGGFRQSYGTQTQVNENNVRCLVEIEGDVTDEQRAQYGQKPLVDVYRKILDLNNYKTDDATLERVQRRGLYCAPVAVTKKAQRTVAPPD